MSRPITCASSRSNTTCRCRIVPLPLYSNCSALAAHRDVRLPKRREAERSVVSLVPLAAHAKERLADEPHRGRRDGARATVAARAEVARDATSDRRQVVAHAAHAMVLAQLPALDGALVVAILPAAARVESPRLNRRVPRSQQCARRATPAECADARMRSSVARSRTTRPAWSTYVNPLRRRPAPNDPPVGHTTPGRRQVQVHVLTFEILRYGSPCGAVTPPPLDAESLECHTLRSSSPSPTASPRSRSTAPTSSTRLNAATIGELGEAIDEIRQRDDIGGAILTGRRPRVRRRRRHQRARGTDADAGEAARAARAADLSAVRDVAEAGHRRGERLRARRRVRARDGLSRSHRERSREVRAAGGEARASVPATAARSGCRGSSARAARCSCS